MLPEALTEMFCVGFLSGATKPNTAGLTVSFIKVKMLL